MDLTPEQQEVLKKLQDFENYLKEEIEKVNQMIEKMEIKNEDSTEN